MYSHVYIIVHLNNYPSKPMYTLIYPYIPMYTWFRTRKSANHGLPARLSNLRNLKQWAISELMFVSVSKWVLVLNYCKGNEFDLHKNTQLISIWMVVHQDSLWNWGMQQLGNGLVAVSGYQNRPPQRLGVFRNQPEVSQRLLFLVLTERIAASGDENTGNSEKT